jgi:hypothetical protein
MFINGMNCIALHFPQLIASLLSLLVLVAIACWAIHDAVVALANAAKLGDAAGSGMLASCDAAIGALYFHPRRVGSALDLSTLAAACISPDVSRLRAPCLVFLFRGMSETMPTQQS